MTDLRLKWSSEYVYDLLCTYLGDLHVLFNINVSNFNAHKRIWPKSCFISFLLDHNNDVYVSFSVYDSNDWHKGMHERIQLEDPTGPERIQQLAHQFLKENWSLK